MAPLFHAPLGGRRPVGAIVRAVGIRVLVWGGLAAVVLLSTTDLRWLLGVNTLSPPVLEQGEPAAPSEPGWPHLRGPRYDAVSAATDLADAWPADGPPLAWMQEIGRGYSGVIAVGGRIFTQRQTPTEQSVLCLDAGSGGLIWEHRYGWAYEPGGMYPGPRATPTWRDGRLYFAAPDGLVGCLHAADGRPLWSVNVNQQFGGRGTEFGYSCSPLVEAGKVILPVGGPAASVVALDARSGSTIWASGSEPASYCSAIPITLKDRRLVVAFLQNVLAAFDLESGEPVFQQGYSQGYDEHAASPLYAEPHLMVMLPFRAGADLYRLEAQGAANADGRPGTVAARLVRHSGELSNDTASSVLVGAHVYGFDLHEAQANGRRPSRGLFKCLELQTGKVCWSTDRVGHATILVADGKLFLFNDKGELILARVNPERYEELGRVRIFKGEVCWTAPALDRGRLYLRSPTRVACLLVGRRAGQELAPTDTMRPAALAAQGEPFDWVRLIGKEREFPFDPPDRAELTRWYLWSLVGAIGGAALIAAVAWLAALKKPAASRRPFACSVFWLGALVLGLALTPLANHMCEGFVFTWSASLFVVHQLVLVAVLGTTRRFGQRLSEWLAPLAVWGLVLVCLGYYELCRRLSLALAWVLLTGFLPSWPLAVPLAGRLLRAGGVAWTAVLTVLAFSLYFWASAACLWLRAWWMP